MSPSPLPFGVPNFIMTGFYAEPGSADALSATLTAEARTLYLAQLAYYRGDAARAGALCAALLENGGLDFTARVGCALFTALCAMYAGDVQGWNRAQAILTALSDQQPQSPALLISAASLSGALYLQEAPPWLRAGEFLGPAAGYPAQSYLYAKHLLVRGDDAGLLCVSAPLRSYARSAGALLPCIYLHLLTAIACHDLGDDAAAAAHIRTAVALGLPDKLYGVFAEHRRALGTLLDEALRASDPAALQTVRAISETLLTGWTALHTALTDDRETAALAPREYEAARLAAQGAKNAGIARRMGISEGSVKAYLHAAYGKLGVRRRGELKRYMLP